MATYKITDASGNVYRITQNEQEEPEKYNDLATAAHGVGQSATFGFSDEIYGRYRDWVHGEDYETARDRYRAELEERKREDPLAYGAGELTGGFLLPGGTFAGLARGASNLSRVARLGRIAGASAAEGALAGYGYSDDGSVGDVVQGAVGGALLGPAMAYGLPAAGNLAGAGVRAVRRTPDDKVRDALSPLLTPQVVDNYEALGSRGMLLDASDELMGLAGAAKDTSSAASTRLTNAINTRERGAQRAVTDIVSEASGTNPARIKSDLEDLRTQRSARADEQYAAVESAVVPRSDDLERLLQLPNIKRYLPAALRDWRSELDPKTMVPLRSPEDNPLEGAGPIPLSFLDTLKKHVDGDLQAMGERLNPRSAQKGQARNLNMAQQGILQRVDNELPEYAAAREDFREFSELIDAANIGKATSRLSDKAMDEARTLQEAIKADPRRQELFRQGTADAILRDVGKAPGNRPDFARRARSEVEGPRRERLEMASKDQESFLKADRLLGAESRFKETAGYLMDARGARTAARKAAQQKANNRLSPLVSAADAATGGVSGVADAAQSAIYNLVSDGLDTRTADRIMELVANPNVDLAEVRRYIDMSDMPPDIGESIMRAISSIPGRWAAGGAAAGVNSLLLSQ